MAHKENIIWRPSNNRPKCGYKIIFTTVSQTAVYSGHSFDIYTFIQHTFCLYLEALNRPHARHAKVIIGTDIIHNQTQARRGRLSARYLVTTQMTIIRTNYHYSRNLQGAAQPTQKPSLFIPATSACKLLLCQLLIDC